MADLLLYDIFDLSPFRNFIRSTGEKRILKKGEHFCRTDAPAPDIAVVDSGGFAFTHPDHKGDNQILSLALTDELIGAYIPMMPGHRSVLDSIALCTSRITAIPLDKAIDYMDNELHPGYRMEFTRSIAFSFMIRGMDQRCKSPEERYRELLSRMPDLPGKISMSAIASYLGITRETFARMRSRMREQTL